MPPDGKQERSGRRKRRCHKAHQLIARPVTFQSCDGPVIVAAVMRRGALVVEIEHPGLPVSQSGSADTTTDLTLPRQNA